MAKDFLIRIVGDASKGISELDRFAKKADDLTHLGQAGMVMGGLIAAGVGLAVSKYSEFDAAMSNVVATGDDAAASQDALRQAAMDAGASTVFSATESANAIEELSKAGISAADTLSGGLAGALDLAAAGGLGVADAAATMATAMTQFSVGGDRATHVADLLAAGAGKAQGDVSDMSQALAQAGLVANATGLSIEETTGGLAAFASAGLLGSDAGTSFKSMLQRLTPQSAAAQNAMDDLGISAYDAGGNFIGLADFAGNLQDSLSSLTPEQRQAAMATIFGSDAVRAATILYNQGAEGIEKWTAAVDDQGYAAETAAKRLDNLQGDLEGLGGALDTALIKQGSGANDSLRALTAAATGAVTGLSELPEPIQQAGLYLGIATAAVGLFGGAAAVGVPKVVAFKTAIDGTKYSMRGLSLAAGGLTIGLAAVISIVAAVAAEQAEAESRAQSYSDTLESGTRRVTAATREMTVANLAASKTEFFHDVGSAYDNAEALGISIDLVTDAAMGSADAITKLSAEIESSKSRHDELGLSAQAATLFADRLSNSVKGEASSLERAGEVARQKEEAERSGAAATEKAAASTDTAAAAYMNAATQAEDLTEELDKLVESMNAANGTNQDAISTNARWRESLDGISGEVKEQREAYERAHGSLDGFSMSLDRSTTSGASMADMLSSVAGNAQAAATAQYEVDKTTVGAKAAADNYAATLATQRAAFEEAARAAGFNAEEVSKLGDEVFALPPEKAVEILAQTGTATQATQDFRALWDGIRSKTISITAIPQIGGGFGESFGPLASGYAFGDGHATGGEIRGPGTRTSDSIPAWLSNEEFVVNANDAQKHLGLLNHINAGGDPSAYMGAMVGASAPSTVRMLPIADSAPASDAASTRRAIREDVQEIVTAALANRPEGDKHYHFPPGPTAEQLLRAMDEEYGMNMRLG